MALLDNHLEQISLSAKTIGELDFPPSKLFTNALLGSHEITTLIRDTEPHERALYSIDPSVVRGTKSQGAESTSLFGSNAQDRRRTVQVAQHRQSSAVAKVLGNDMLKQIQQSQRGYGKRPVNVEVLLQGAERLCSVYAIPGASDRITALRNRHARVAASVAEYEAKALKQQTRLNHSNRSFDPPEAGEDDGSTTPLATVADSVMTEERMRAEEEEIKDLEARKKALEDRVAGMEKDLGGLLR